MRGDILSTDKHRLEKEVEEKWIKHAKQHGWKTYKFRSPGNSSVPDRIFIKRRPDGTAFVFFIEFKRPGKTSNANQILEQKLLRELGFWVIEIDYYDKEFVEWLLSLPV